MRKLKGILVLILLLALLASPIVALASDISGARYYGTIIISNNGTATSAVAVTCNISTLSLINGGYLNSSANNCVVRSSAGADLPFMPGITDDPWSWCIWVPSIGQNASTADILYTANSTGGEIRYFPAAEGMSTTDNASLELGDNFTVEQSGWWDTDLSAGKNAVYKEGAFKTYISASENITSAISGGDDYLDFVAANNDWVQVLDHNDFSFTDGNDLPFTVTAWVNFDAGATVKSIVAKYTVAGNLREWRLLKDAADLITFNTYHNDDVNKTVGRKTGDISAYDGTWIHLAATYNGSETNAGFNIYLNGTDIDTGDNGAGAYTGMTNTASDLEIGSIEGGTQVWMNGGIAEVKIYARELTPTQVADDYLSLVSTTDLNGWWRIDDGAGNPTDSSGKGHNANANTADWATGFTAGWRTATSVTATGVESGEYEVRTDQGEHALEFNGTSDEISLIGGIGAFSFIQNTGIFTILAWVKLDDYTADAAQTIAGNTPATAEKGFWFLYDNRSVVPATSQLHLEILKGVGGDPIISSFSTTNVITDNKYHYVGVTGNGTNVIFYVDGEAYAGTNTMDAGKSSGDSTRVLAMAKYEAAAPSAYWDGQFAEARIYSRTLSPAEVQERYNGTFTDETDLELKFDLNEGTGGVATDTSGNGYNGTLDIVGWVVGMLRIYVDDSLMDANAGVSVPSNSENWTFCTNDVLRYLEYQEISVNSTQVQYIDWEYDTTFSDNSSFDNDATPTFRDTSSDADVSAVFTSFLPVSEAKAPAYALEDAPAFIETVPTIVSEWDVTPPAGTFPLAGVITAVANATDTPAQLPLLIIAGFVIIACSLTASATMRRFGSGSLIVKSAVITAIMGIFIAIGNFGIDFWMLFVFLIIAIALSMGSKQVGWQ